MDKLPLLFITLFCITSSFFIGYFFGKDVTLQEIETLKRSLQVSIHIHGNTLDVIKSHSDIRVIIDGKELSGTGEITIKK